MGKQLLVIAVLTATIFGGCGGEENAATQRNAADDAYERVAEIRRVADSPDDRVAITKEFLDEFPESKHTAGALNAILYYQGTEMDDLSGAIAYAEEIRAKIDDPKIALEVDKELLGSYGESGMATRMTALANRLDAAGELDFGGHWNVIEGAVNAEDWKLTREYCAKARGMANAETYRADNSVYDLSEEEVEKAVNEWVGMLLVKDGWARANQGQVDEALVDFARADKLIPRYYFDIAEYDLNVYWANTLVMKGDFEAAIDKAARYALVMRNEEAMAGLKQAYAGMNGGTSGWEAYAAELHRSVAGTQDEFEMPDYAGKRHRFADIRGDVTLVALWFPT